MVSSSRGGNTKEAGGERWLDRLVVRRGTAPMYRQIHDLVQQGITEGHLRAGQQLPSEGELASRWGVSVAPVRQALLDLAGEGYLERGQGRGTFVRKPKLEEKLSILSSFSSSHAQRGNQSELVVLSTTVTGAAPEASAALGTGKRNLIRIQRVAYLESDPIALLAAYLDPRRFPGLEDMPLEGGSLYRTLTSAYGVDLVRAHTVLEAIPGGDDEAAVLQLRAGTMVLAVDSTTFDRQDTPVEFSRVLYRMDRFRFSLESHRLDDRVLHFAVPAETSEASVDA